MIQLHGHANVDFPLERNGGKQKVHMMHNANDDLSRGIDSITILQVAAIGTQRDRFSSRDSASDKKSKDIFVCI